MATFKPVVLKNSTHIKLDGTTNIKIRLYHNTKSQYISTPYYIHPNAMLKSGCITDNYHNSIQLNYEIGNIIQKCRSVCIELGIHRVAKMSCIEVKEQIIAAMQPKYELMDFVAYSDMIIGKTKKEKTAEWYQRGIDTLCWYYNRKEIDIRDLTAQRLNQMKEALETKGPGGNPLEPGAVSNYLRAIRALFNKAKKHFNNEDYDIIRVPNDPFSKITIPKYRRRKKTLTIDNINRIRCGVFSCERANMARDVFMIMFYMMGINISDLYNLRKTSCGRIEYERSKTRTEDNIFQFPLSIRIEPELDVLIGNYSDIGFLSYFRRKYNCSKNFMRAVNEGLKIISEELNLNVKLSSNWARHSWASIARNKAGIPKADIDFCLGHVNNDYKMADIYIDIDYSIYDKTNRIVLDLLK